MRLYNTASAIGVCSAIAGGVALLSHVSGQLQEGSGSAESLVGGGVARVLGCLFLLLGDMGQRLVRVEQKLRSEPNSE